MRTTKSSSGYDIVIRTQTKDGSGNILEDKIIDIYSLKAIFGTDLSKILEYSITAFIFEIKRMDIDSF